MKTNPRDIILYPIYTEKTVAIGEDGRVVTFAVAKGTNKIQIKKAIEEIFDVKVNKVNIVNVRPKTKKVGKYTGKTAAVKKAIITLAEGDTIEVL
ncbi:MAG TPA: 50S ribosomal protein L23 [Erysipelothrix sp.]|jgi:large subunit ribosomal protein L23|nr:50S ribosomal protein L23 [Erysipelothrix sp.]